LQGGQEIGIITVVEGQSMVDRLTLDPARCTTPADAPALLQHTDVNALLTERARAGQAGESRADHQNFGRAAVLRSRVTRHS
jgi:hypothetical protein